FIAETNSTAQRLRAHCCLAHTVACRGKSKGELVIATVRPAAMRAQSATPNARLSGASGI
ncbi:hypothetical protein SIL85_22250, partial [Shewanella oneidensis]|uniref:hypothetical protein n=1 Tax=Shewanella oneidensis TaxID=70863 RepID=UPI0029C13689